ncbi:MAG: hypothetical protein EBQ89_00580 [Alphaproteobacteria bacterium]|nr:hypothetical protein [Alphaproteobacteria bacterium]
MKTKLVDKDNDGVNDPEELRWMDAGHSPHKTKIDYLIHRLSTNVNGLRRRQDPQVNPKPAS